MTDPKTPHRGVQPSEQDPAKELAPLPPYRILVVEDSQANRTFAKQILSQWRQTVATANNGREAIEMLACEKFDLVLMDMHMPETDGLETTMAIRENERQTGRRHLPIIAMTGATMVGDRQRCLDVGMDSYVSKPIDGSELHAAIAELMTSPSGTTPQRNNLPSATSRHACGSQAGTSSGEGRVFDQESFLRRIGDEELAREMIRACVRDDFPRLFGDLQHAVGADDAPAIERAAHALKGSLGELGATTAQALAAELELVGREQRWNQLHRNYDQFVLEVEDMSRELELFLGGRNRTDEKN